jgi:hypothetical protein
MKTIFCAQKDHGQAGQQPPCYWHILLDVKIDLAPNLHSVAKSAGSWVQEKIERDTAALNLHSSTDGMPLVHWSKIITSLHRPPQKTKRFRVDMAIKLYQVIHFIHRSSQSPHLQPPGPGRPSWRSYCGTQSSWYRRKTIEIDEKYRKIWDKHDKSILTSIYEILYVTLRWLVSSPIWCKTRDAHHGFSPLHDPWRSFLAVGLDFEEYVTQVWKLWINHRSYEDFVFSLINYIQLFENEAEFRKSHLIKKTIPETAQMWDNQFTCWPSWFRSSGKTALVAVEI